MTASVFVLAACSAFTGISVQTDRNPHYGSHSQTIARCGPAGKGGNKKSMTGAVESSDEPVIFHGRCCPRQGPRSSHADHAEQQMCVVFDHRQAAYPRRFLFDATNFRESETSLFPRPDLSGFDQSSISQQDVRDSYVRSTVFMPSCAMTDANICKALPDITHALSLSLATSESDPCLRSSASEPESVFARRGRRPALRLRRCTNRASG